MNVDDSSMPEASTTMLKLACHLREPQNIINYLVLSAWLKYMEMTQYLPSITIG
jgi:hypothetical protein